jgi:hypothetical protein
MTREEIIRLAEQAGNGEVRDPFTTHMFFVDELERFVALVAAAEREACARICRDLGRGHNVAFAEFDCVEAIRARGQE